MSVLGDLLKQRRTEKGLSKEDISRATAIRKQWLDLMEEGRFDEMPSYVHAHGFLVQYAKAVGLDFEQEVKPLFDEECRKNKFRNAEGDGGEEEGEEAAEAVPEKSSPDIPFKQIAIVAALLIIVVVIITMVRPDKEQASAPVTQPVQENSVPLPEPVIEPEDVLPADNDTISADNMTVSAVEPPPPVPDNQSAQPVATVARHTATLNFSQTCWVYIKTDLGNEFDFIAEGGNASNISFNSYFQMHVGNAAAISVSYKDSNLSELGREGQVIRNIYISVTPEGALAMSRAAPGA